MVATTYTATYAGAVANSGTELFHGDDDCLKADQGRDGVVGGDDVEYRLSTPVPAPVKRTTMVSLIWMWREALC